MSGTLLQTVGITKQYPGVVALDAVNFSLKAGEVHVLFGENGAGKSTLIGLLAGSRQPSAGQIHLRGKPVHIDSVHAARDLGISAVFQEFSLIPQMSVEENLFLGAEMRRGLLLRKRAQRQEAARILSELEFDLDPTRRVDTLTRAEQQMVEIAKAFRSELSVLILDEPTASLTQRETDQLFALVRKLKQDGVGIIYITHRMAEISAIGDRVTVLRDGQYIDTVPARETSEDDLVRLMTGREVGQVFPSIAHRPGRVVLDAQDISTVDGRVKSGSMTVHAGEILGLAGLVGSGKSEFMQACFGLMPLASGTLTLDGKAQTTLRPRAMIDQGFLYLPADRHREGLMLMRSVRENMSLGALSGERFRRGPFLRRRSEAAMARELAERLQLSPPHTERAVNDFSGGNQQKVMLARSLTRDLKLIVFDEPTVGVDVGTRAAIYAFIGELCEAGVAIVLISSDLPEVLNLSHRCQVFYGGRCQAELAGDAITEATVLEHFFERKAA